MSTEEQFKKSLNDLLNSKEFPFEEANWVEAQALIDGSRRKRRGLLIFLSALLILGGGAGLYMLLPEKPLTAHTETVAAPIAPAVAPTEIPATIIPAEKAILPEKQANSTAEKSAPVAASHLVQAKSTKSDMPAVPELPVIANVRVAANPVAPSEPVKEVALKETPVIENTVKETPFIENTVKETPVQIEIPSPIAVTQVPVLNESAQPTAEPLKEEKENTQSGVTENKNFVDYTTKAVPVTEEPVVNQANLPPVQPVTAKTEEALETQPLKTTSEAKPAETAMPSETVIPEPVAEKIISAPDTLSAVATARPDTDYVRLKNPLLTIEGGMAGLKGWNNGERSEAAGFNPIIGINYFTHFAPRWALSIGAQYSSVAELQNSQVISKKTKLGLGEYSQVTVFTPVKLHYITAPLRLNHQLNNSSFIGVGCNIARLLTVDCEIEQYTQINNTTTDHRFSKDRGYTQGFNSWDTQAAIFYKRRLYKEFYMNAEFFYGFTDIKDDLFFKTQGQEKNIGLKLTLVYTLLKTK